MLSKVFIIGRITAKPTLTMLSTNSRVMSKFSVAVNKNNGSGQADFFNVVAFDKIAELVEKYLSKGSLIYIEGNLRQSNYTNNEGRKIYSIDIIANNVIFLDNRNSNNSNNSNAIAQTNKSTDFLATEMLQNFQTQMSANDGEISFSNKSISKDLNQPSKDLHNADENIQWESNDEK